ncbi:MAG: tRNA (N6-threonylcarbamoyladenosine(37)-N6)-methyltransferase TrmO [Oscillospiraceae bacterium]|nr:tRNA (N6-threonylcarbamoyladenosine(37)-N6)-methyltransferase TrmO [Oscillospiraceae bacterium]
MANDIYELKVIARVRNDLREKFGIPRQSGLVPELLSAVVFEKGFRSPDALRGIEGFSHLWLLWVFSENVRDTWSPTVRPPRLGGNERLGVFATRSPFRPNPVGLSCVGLVRVEHTKAEGDILIVSGADLMDGTPILDIKPYVAYADARPDAVCGFVDEKPWRPLAVDFPEEPASLMEPEQRVSLVKLLENDPRPPYHGDGRVYRMRFGDFDVAFTVSDGTLHVTEVKVLEKGKNDT